MIGEISRDEVRSAIEDKLCAQFTVTGATADDEQIFQATAMVIRAERSVPMASSGKAISTSARRIGPWSAGASGQLGVSASASGRMARTRAATLAFNSGVSPGTGTNVPVDWSLAIFAAMASMLPGVSIL